MMVTKRFEKVIDKVGKLPAEEQDALAEWILEELADEQRWQESFAKSQNTLEKMADKALQEHERGNTSPLDLSEL
jgi:DNA-binding protein H-NS